MQFIRSVSSYYYFFSSSELFTTVLDMLAALIHTTQVSDTSSSDRGEENRKQYLNLVKKLKVRLFAFICIFPSIFIYLFYFYLNDTPKIQLFDFATIVTYGR